MNVLSHVFKKNRLYLPPERCAASLLESLRMPGCGSRRCPCFQLCVFLLVDNKILDACRFLPEVGCQCTRNASHSSGEEQGDYVELQRSRSEVELLVIPALQLLAYTCAERIRTSHGRLLPCLSLCWMLQRPSSGPSSLPQLKRDHTGASSTALP